MKKRNLKSLKLNKKNISSLRTTKVVGGTIVIRSMWNSCTCPPLPPPPPSSLPLQTNEGPCPGGTTGCNTTFNTIP